MSHFLGADDGIRTRDPHLGKVMENVQMDAYRSFRCGCVRHFVQYVHLIRACRSALYHEAPSLPDLAVGRSTGTRTNQQNVALRAPGGTRPIQEA